MKLRMWGIALYLSWRSMLTGSRRELFRIPAKTCNSSFSSSRIQNLQTNYSEPSDKIGGSWFDVKSKVSLPKNGTFELVWSSRTQWCSLHPRSPRFEGVLGLSVRKRRKRESSCKRDRAYGRERERVCVCDWRLCGPHTSTNPLTQPHQKCFKI